MLFKIINKDKVKVIIEKEERDKFNDFDGKVVTEKAGDVLAELLIRIYEQTGINFLNSKIILETVQGISESYYITVTRIIDSSLECNDCYIEDEVDMYIFKLNGIETVFDIADVINNYDTINRYRSELYKYKKQEYVCIYFKQNLVKKDFFDRMIDEIDAIASRCRWNVLNESLLHEWGQRICGKILENINGATN